MSARDLLADAAARLGLDASLVAEIFDGAPLDFPVVVASHLPLLADRFGMVGITLAGRVWLLESVRDLPADALIALIRHEAEHVRQQRERPLLFFLRYGLGYIRGLLRNGAPVAWRTTSPSAQGASAPSPGTAAPATLRSPSALIGRVRSRAYLAYRSIGYEREAYRAEAEARARIERWRASRGI